MKITVLGDIMCEPSLLKTSQTDQDSYNFDGVFEKIKPLLSEADYVIANMEFPLAGKQAGYSPTFFSFNAPDEFASAIKNAGIDLVSTVNNHSLDKGIDGLYRTLRVLDEEGIDRVGTFLPHEEHKEAFYFTVDGVRFAVVAYTYTTNKKLPEGDANEININYLRKPQMSAYTPEIRKKMKTWVDKVFKKLKEQDRAVIRKWVGLPNTLERADDNMEPECFSPYIDRFTEDIKKAKENADFVICYPHTGGQFNRQIGKFSEYTVQKAIEAGADAILAHHSHIVQKAEWKDNIPVAYSLGNFSMCPNSSIIIKKYLPDYGLAFHLYMNKNNVEKATFSILKGVEKKGEQLVSWPIDELYKALKTTREKKKLEEHVKTVYRFVTEKELIGNIIRKEYEL